MLFRGSEKGTIVRDRKVSEDEMSEEKEKDEFTILVEQEKDHDIKYRTLSWKKTAYLLVCEYFGLASMALPWSFSVLGWGTGMTVLIVAGMVTWCEYGVERSVCQPTLAASESGWMAVNPEFQLTAQTPRTSCGSSA